MHSFHLSTFQGQSGWKHPCGYRQGQRRCPTPIPSRWIHVTMLPHRNWTDPWDHILGEAKLGTDESTFNAILATRSWAQICQIMTEYQRMHGNSLEKVVASEFSANAEKGLLAICKFWLVSRFGLFRDYCWCICSALRSESVELLCRASAQGHQWSRHQRWLPHPYHRHPLRYRSG